MSFLYLPESFRADDPAVAWAVAERHPFGLLLTRELRVNALPWLADPGRRVLSAHVAAANPVATGLDGERVAVVFQGPHAYVSPTWYREPDKRVPTWNYVLARAEGTARVLPRDRTRALLVDLCARFEEPGGYDPRRVDPDTLEAMLGAIVGFEVEVEVFEAKLKLSQNREEADRLRVLEALAGTELAAWMDRAR